MNIEKKVEKNKLYVKISGRLDTNTAPELENELLEKDISNVNELLFDFKDLKYISSAGLRVILFTHKKIHKQGGKMSIRNVNENIMEIFVMTGFSNFLTIV
jgi:anti-sigma B factor antagonist